MIENLISKIDKRRLARLLPLIYRLRLIGWWVRRPMSVGARMVVIDSDQVLLVRGHGNAWWNLPGGAVKRGESLPEGAAREAREETGYSVVTGELLGMYFNSSEYKSDHIAIFIGHLAGNERSTHTDSFEIAEARFFPLDALPERVERSTRARLAEYLAGKRGICVPWNV